MSDSLGVNRTAKWWFSVRGIWRYGAPVARGVAQSEAGAAAKRRATALQLKGPSSRAEMTMMR